MIIDNKGIQTAKFYLPPFQLKKGEIAIIRLKNNLESVVIEKELTQLLSKKNIDKDIISTERFTFANYKKDSLISKIFYKNNVKNYLKRNANLKSPFASKIYEIDWIKPNTLLNRLP